MPEQVGADLALFEVVHEDAVNPPRQQPGQIALAQAERQLADIVAVAESSCLNARKP